MTQFLHYKTQLDDNYMSISKKNLFVRSRTVTYVIASVTCMDHSSALAKLIAKRDAPCCFRRYLAAL